MTTLISKSLKTLALCFLTLTFLTLAQVEARADEVTVSGTTSGSFSGPSTGLTFTSGSFSVTTVGGFTSVGNVNTSQDSLGTIRLDNANASYNNTTFALTVNFTAPGGINGTSSTTYTAVLTGTVVSDGRGGVFFNFDNNPVTFTFNTPNGVGTFSMTINDVSVNNAMGGGLVALSGNITGFQPAAAVPEPATLLLLGTGLTGVAARIRKRRKAAKAESNV